MLQMTRWLKAAAAIDIPKSGIPMHNAFSIPEWVRLEGERGPRLRMRLREGRKEFSKGKADANGGRGGGEGAQNGGE